MTNGKLKTTLTNDFHGTRVETDYTAEELKAIEFKIETASPEYYDSDGVAQYGEDYDEDIAEAQRIWRALCGIDGCTCGDYFGRR